MALQAQRQYLFGGVDSQSNPLVMPPDRSLRCLNWMPTKDRHIRLRDGYTEVAIVKGTDIMYTAPTAIEGDTLEILRPTSATGGYSNSVNAYDGSDTTPSSATAWDYPASFYGGSDSEGGPFTETWSFSARTGDTPTSVKLQIRSSSAKYIGSYYTWEIDPVSMRPYVSGTVLGSGTVACVLSYSIDGGSSWTEIYSSENRATQWDEITLSTGLDFSNLKVKADCSVSGTAISSTHNIFEIKVEVQTAAA